MSLKKFGRSDVIRNAMRAYPHNSFFIYSSSVYYDHRPIEQGAFNSDILSASGGISLFEYNVDRSGSTEFTSSLAVDAEDSLNLDGDNPPIIPYVFRGSNRQFLKASSRTLSIDSVTGEKTGGIVDVSDAFAASDGTTSIFTGSTYPASASITRELMTAAGGKTETVTDVFQTNYPHYYGLRNSLNFYGTRSPHYFVEFSSSVTGQWNKDEQDINLISVPKIFYGSRIKPGSLSLKFYITGTMVGELQDSKYNGELIQVGPEGSEGSGSVAGVAMYEEGFVLLTGSWDLTNTVTYDFDSTTTTGSWTRFACGANDGITCSDSASFDFSFKGHTETQVLTMFAHARRGEVNYSNNPTFLEYGQNRVEVTSSNVYLESDSVTIKNTVSSSYAGFDAPFERQVYISRVAIYDEDKKLIGIATLSNPVLKKEAQDLSFKLKLDI
ncbi:MAG: hypothetical protein NWE77_05160 [Candidatus Bathyarchaeota archaeon]|nr:hypothetical protein [Candidatus Bathyarchaeota archaeon]